MRRILTTLLLVASSTWPALATDYSGGPVGWQKYFSTFGGPSCDQPSVLARVTEKFAYQDAHVVHSGIGITGIDNIREKPLRVDGAGLVHRRYCEGTAWLSNGRKAELAYLIEGPALATFSVGWHVESCVVGIDPWRVYDRHCRAIRP
ncbi:MAG TPA: hypothetical protein VII91_07150 [Bauldia sp.]|jgi:hypothetical protein